MKRITDIDNIRQRIEWVNFYLTDKQAQNMENRLTSKSISSWNRQFNELNNLRHSCLDKFVTHFGNWYLQ